MRKLNLDAKNNRHQKIGLTKKSFLGIKNSSGFIRKFLFLALFVGIVDFSNAQFYRYYISDEGAYDYIPLEIKQSTYIEEPGFALKKSIQTQAGDRTRQNDILQHTVQGGESLNKIAKDYGISLRTILLANPNILSPELIKGGQVINIPPVNGIVHVVNKPTTIEQIANQYKIEKDIIIRQNKLGTGVITLQKGKILIIPGEEIVREKFIAKEKEIEQKRKIAIAKTNNRRNTGGGTIKRPTRSYPAPKGNGTLLKPSAGVYTQYYHSSHFGVDIANGGGGPIFAAEKGKVIKAKSSGWNGGYGNVIIIDHGNGTKTLYAHNKEIYVKPGQEVQRGEQIAFMGNTGRVYGRTGIHLHFEVIVNGKKKNPLAYYK